MTGSIGACTCWAGQVAGSIGTCTCTYTHTTMYMHTGQVLTGSECEPSQTWGHSLGLCVGHIPDNGSMCHRHGVAMATTLCSARLSHLKTHSHIVCVTSTAVPLLSSRLRYHSHMHSPCLSPAHAQSPIPPLGSIPMAT